MKVAIIGGSAQSTPALINYLASEACTGALQLTLIGRSKERLAAVGRASKVLSNGGPIRIECAELRSPEFDRAIENANVVILQLRVGGYAGRDYDETFPLKYGVCGDEGLGPGGLSTAWRGWPEIAPLIDRVNAAAPGALLLVLSSPLGIMVRAATRICSRVRVLGICELPWTTLQDICGSVGESPDHALFEYFGVNHMGWFHYVSVDGRDLVREYTCSQRGKLTFPSDKLIEQCSGVPTKYLKLHYHRERVINHQRRLNKSRGKTLDELSRAAFPIYSSGTREEIKTVLGRRPTPWYSDAVGPLLVSLMGRNVRIPFFLSAPNEGSYARLREDDILEMPYVVEEGRLKRLKQSRPIPEHMAELIGAFVESERLAATAVIHRDVSLLEQSLRVHPWTRELKNMQKMVSDITQISQ